MPAWHIEDDAISCVFHRIFLGNVPRTPVKSTSRESQKSRPSLDGSFDPASVFPVLLFVCNVVNNRTYRLPAGCPKTDTGTSSLVVRDYC
jgi:hypothetical protein